MFDPAKAQKIPAILMLVLRIQEEDTVQNWVCLFISGTAICLLSGMGIAAGLIMILVYGLYIIIRAMIRGWKTGLKRIPLWLLCLAPEILFGLGYFLLKG